MSREELQRLAGPEYEDLDESLNPNTEPNEDSEPIDDEKNIDAWEGGFAENH